MKVLTKNVRKVKSMLSYEEYTSEMTKLIRCELNSKTYISLGAVAAKVVDFAKEQGDPCITFMTAMDLVDAEAQKLMKALKECAI